MILLSIGLGYIHYAIKRQSENRHYLIMQGFSFLYTYYHDRKLSDVPSERQEAEFNVGRAYHMLGLTHLGIPYYERCLAMSDSVQEAVHGSVVENFAKEAAYALQSIWAAGGDFSRTRRITDKWLVL